MNREQDSCHWYVLDGDVLRPWGPEDVDRDPLGERFVMPDGSIVHLSFPEHIRCAIERTDLRWEKAQAGNMSLEEISSDWKSHKEDSHTIRQYHEVLWERLKVLRGGA